MMTVRLRPTSLEVLVFARIISAQTTADQVNDVIEIAKQQLPGARGQRDTRASMSWPIVPPASS